MSDQQSTKKIVAVSELPPSWVKSTLQGVSTVIMGQSPSSRYYNSDGKGLPFFQGKAEFGVIYPRPVKWCTEPAKVAKKDDVLISVRAPVGPTNLAPSECCIGRGLAAIRPNAGVLGKYIFHYLRSIESEVESLGTGTTFKAISGGILRSLPIPIAPLSEQERIVSEIEKQFSRLDEAIVSLKHAKANLKRYKAAVLKAAVEGRLTEQWRKEHPHVEPAKKLLDRILTERRKKWEQAELTKMKVQGKEPEDEGWKRGYKNPNPPSYEDLPAIPHGWHWVSTDQLFWFVTSGSRGWAKYYSDTGPLFLRVSNLDHDSIRLDLRDRQRVQPPEGAEGLRTRVEPRDILISITADVGMTAVVPDDFEQAFINQHISLAKPVEAVESAYVAWYLAARPGQKQFQNLQRGATKVGLGLDDIRSINVLLPPLEEQREIVSQIERRISIVDELDQDLDANFRRIECLRKSILHKAFSGRLVKGTY